jgi:hypothetical protein
VVVDRRAQFGEDAAAAVEQQPRAVLLDEIAGAGAVGVLPAGRLPEDREAHAVWHPTGNDPAVAQVIRLPADAVRRVA